MKDSEKNAIIAPAVSILLSMDISNTEPFWMLASLLFLAFGIYSFWKKGE